MRFEGASTRARRPATRPCLCKPKACSWQATLHLGCPDQEIGWGGGTVGLVNRGTARVAAVYMESSLLSRRDVNRPVPVLQITDDQTPIFEPCFENHVVIGQQGLRDATVTVH